MKKLIQKLVRAVQKGEKKSKGTFKEQNNKNTKRNVRIFLITFIVFSLFMADAMWFAYNEPEEVSYSQFLSDVKNHKVDTVYYKTSKEKMRYTLYNNKTRNMSDEDKELYQYPKEYWRETYYPATQGFREQMLKAGVKVEIMDFSTNFGRFASLLPSLVSLAFISLLIYVLLQSLGKGTGSSIEVTENIDTRFKDIIGHDEIIDDLNFVVSILRGEVKSSLGITPPKGVLLSGPPGTGKTLTARAIAGEAGVPFIYVNSSSMIELYVGVGSKRIRQVYEKARKLQPCIVFFDEIDSVGKRRGMMGASSEDDRTINALLQEMDGFSSKDDRIITIAATNNEGALDPALTRAGRFDKKIMILPPRNWKIRRQMLDYYLKDKKLSDNVDLDEISKQLSGFTGADISVLCNEAAIITASKKQEVIQSAYIDEAIDKVLTKGNRTKDKVDRRELEIVALHESGHAICSWVLGVKISRITVHGTTSGVGGFVLNSDDGKETLKSRRDLETSMIVLYGGRVAEALIRGFDNVTTGAVNDIIELSKIIEAFVETYHFATGYYQKRYREKQSNIKIGSPSMEDELMKELVDDIAFNRCWCLLTEMKPYLLKLKDKVLDEETLTGADMDEFMNSIIEDERLKRWVTYVRLHGVKLEDEDEEVHMFRGLADSTD